MELQASLKEALFIIKFQGHGAIFQKRVTKLCKNSGIFGCNFLPFRASFLAYTNKKEFVLRKIYYYQSIGKPEIFKCICFLCKKIVRLNIEKWLITLNPISTISGV